MNKIDQTGIKDEEQIRKLFRKVDSYLESHNEQEVNVGEFKEVLGKVIPYLEIAAPNIPGGMDILSTWRETYAKLEKEEKNKYVSFHYGNWFGQPRILDLNIYEGQRGKCFSFKEILITGNKKHANKLERIIASMISFINPEPRNEIQSTDDSLKIFENHIAKCGKCSELYYGYVMGLGL